MDKIPRSQNPVPWSQNPVPRLPGVEPEPSRPRMRYLHTPEVLPSFPTSLPVTTEEIYPEKQGISSVPALPIQASQPIEKIPESPGRRGRKLTAEQVLSLCEDYRGGGKGSSQLAAELGVSEKLVRNITAGVAYADVTGGDAVIPLQRPAGPGVFTRGEAEAYRRRVRAGALDAKQIAREKRTSLTAVYNMLSGRTYPPPVSEDVARMFAGVPPAPEG